ncbi:XRE family transcriptional regulator [Actinomadura darangshiensis]|uniref:XRE family transcriptional regulator n=1 Tax=Actinomadura darangshiensis TaxID=705336 RepID=A0A4R5ABL3_9ACTN|nr:helix-turn-helix transcriptional regulator [Actinomadura darangshiensis]TDD67152.1 XRE family transcriptional regulator [Actinomadura darangshiensis]
MSADSVRIGARLRAAREAQKTQGGGHWSRAEMARRLRDAATHRNRQRLPGVPSLASMIKDWENGRYSPKGDYRRLYCRALMTSEDQLFGDEELAVQEAVAHRGRDELRRDLNDMLSSGAMSAAALESWEETALRYGLAAREQPPARVATDLEDDLEELRAGLERYRSVSTLRRLTRITAQMSGLMCLTLIKLGEQPAFRCWARTARIAAGEAEDSPTRSWVLAQEAYGHFYTGNLIQAVAVAQDAQRMAESSVGAVLAVALEARAHAALGPKHGEACRSALHRAEDILGGLPNEAINSSAFGYSEAQLRFHEGNALTYLGDTGAAWTAQQRALALCPANDFTDRTLIHLDHTLCLTRDGAITEALACAVAALEPLSEVQREGIISLRGSEVLDTISESQRRLPAARQLQELLTTTPETRRHPT